MNDELEWRERRRHRLGADSDLRRALNEWLVAAEMAWASRFGHRYRFSLALEGPDQHLLAGNPVEREPSRIAPLEFRGKPFAARPIPNDLSRGEAFADCVQDERE